MTSTRQQPRVHRISRNHREWSPPQVIYLSALGSPQQADRSVVHLLAGWAARLAVRRHRYASGTGTVTAWGSTAVQLAAQVDHWCAGQRTMWLYAWSLSWSLAITKLPGQLAALGWEVTAHAVASDSPWLRMRKAGCVLTMADGYGWLRANPPDIMRDLGTAAAWQPDPDDEWPERLIAAGLEAHALATAMDQVMTWWDAAGLGWWTLTGSAAGWNTYRHRSPGPLPLIIPGSGEAEHDRGAIYGGRREAFRHGTLTGGPWILADFKDAYPTIAASMPLPVQRQGSFNRLGLDSPIICGQQYGIIAQVTVDTPVPRWPVRVNKRVAYPTGRFTTTLAGPEILEARRLGCLISIGPGRMHVLSWHMQDWARWIMTVTGGADPSVPPCARRAVKHWGRAVIGKFAAHGFETRPLKSLGGDGWVSRPAWNAAAMAPSFLTEVCGQAAETISVGDGDNAYPAVLAFVESWTRVFLTRAMEACGLQNVVSCDTDGMILTAVSGLQQLDDGDVTGPLEMRVKNTYQQVRMIGPQHVITDVDRKLSGIPRTAVETTDRQFEALLWPKLSWQMEANPGTSQAAYTQPVATYTLPETTITGWCLPDGTVQPLQAATCSDGGCHLLPWQQAVPYVDGMVKQASHLRLMTEPLPGRNHPCSHRSPRSHGTATASMASAPTTSSTSAPNPDGTRAAKAPPWQSSGASSAASPSRASSGWTRTSQLIRTTWTKFRSRRTSTRTWSTSPATGSGQPQPAVTSGSGASEPGQATSRS